jgi:hypothetical protein
MACSLAAGQLKQREKELEALGRREVISVSVGDGLPAVVSFKTDPETRAALERVVRAEAECCPFLEMKISDGDSLDLTIDGPADAAPIVEGLVDAISGSPDRAGQAGS